MADKTINVRHVQKHDTENNWSSKNPVLLAGEMAFTTDGTNAGKYKLGDGTSKWSALSYAKAKLEKSDVTTALGYTPPTTNTTYSTGTASTSGLTKLYTSTGSATDGTMTQAAINTALSGKASSSHTHTKSQITDFPTSLPANGGNASTANKLTTARSISLGSGASGSVNFDGSGNVTLPVNSVSEAYLSWGGKNFSGSYGCIDAAMISELGANRLAFGSGEGISVEYSRDSGSTWTDYGLPAGSRSSILSTGYNVYIGKADSSNKATATYMLRITLDTDKIQVYTQLNKFAIYLSTNGCNGCYCSIDASLEATPTKWVNFANKVDVSGWSGWNIINTKTITTYGNSSSVQYGLIRFTFGCTSGSTNYTGLNISKIMGFGGVGWTTPSNMASNGHLYSYDRYQNAAFPGTVKAKSFNGTATSATTAENVTGVEASANVDRHVWFSDGGSETVRGYDDNFKYNPTTKLLSTNISGNASTASKLGTGTTGSATQPVYFSNGKPVATTYTLGKSVPSNAAFTDTNTWRPLGTTADTACAGNDSRLSNARPASDVYSWAKASSKPSYTKSEVGLGNVDNTADSQKSVKYATSAGSANSVTWENVSGKPSTFTPSSHTHSYAGSSSAGGSATSAVKLDSSAGSVTQPIYFSGGKPTACSYTLGKSVPSNAVFTDTTYTVASTSKDGLMSSADKTALTSVVSRVKRNVFVITDSYGVYKSNSDASGDPMVFPSYFTKVFNFMGFVAHHGGNFNAGASNSADFAAIYKNEAKPKITADLTDLIIVGGFNDREAEPSAIHAGIKRLYDAVIKDYPNCKISIGHFGWSSTPDSEVRDSMLTHSLVAYRACTTDGCAYMPNSEYTMHNYSLFTTDNVHPNTNGKAEIVKQIFEYLCTGTCDVHYPYRLITIPATGNITTAYQVGFKLDNNIVTMYLPNTSLTFKKYPPMGANALSQFMCIASIGSRDTCGYAMGMYDDKYHVQKSLPIKGYFTCSDGTFRPLDPCDFYLQGGFIMCRANILASPTSAYLPDFYATGFQIRGCVIQLTCDQC